jgi:flagellar motor switch protein FliN/FliY
MMTGSSVTVQLSQVDSVGKESFLQRLPDMAVSVKADYSSGIVGEHCYVMAKDTAQRIASLMNKEENIELDDMAMSVIGEVVSQLSGSQITALSDKTGNKGISAEPPQAVFQPKAMLSLPSGDFARATYQIDLGDGQSGTVGRCSAPAPSGYRPFTRGESSGMDMGSAAGFGGSMGGGFPGGMGGGMPPWEEWPACRCLPWGASAWAAAR